MNVNIGAAILLACISAVASLRADDCEGLFNEACISYKHEMKFSQKKQFQIASWDIVSRQNWYCILCALVTIFLVILFIFI